MTDWTKLIYLFGYFFNPCPIKTLPAFSGSTKFVPVWRCRRGFHTKLRPVFFTQEVKSLKSLKLIWIWFELIHFFLRLKMRQVTKKMVLLIVRIDRSSLSSQHSIGNLSWKKNTFKHCILLKPLHQCVRLQASLEKWFITGFRIYCFKKKCNKYWLNCFYFQIWLNAV